MEIGDYIRTRTVLGAGSFGTVYLGYKKDDPTHEVAIKEFKLNDAFMSELALAEALTGDKGCSPHFVCFEKAYKLKSNYYIIYKKAWGDLNKWMESKGGSGYFNNLSPTNLFDKPYMNKVTDKERMSFIISMLNALNEMHNNGIVHRDIKPDNILVYKERDNWTFTLGDLGSLCADKNMKGKFNIPEKYNCIPNEMGKTTLWFIPNKMKRRQPTRDTNVSYNDMDEQYLTDISAMGCVLYTFLTGMIPCSPLSIFVPLKYPNDIVYNGNIIKKEDISNMVNSMIISDEFRSFKSNPCGK